MSSGPNYGKNLKKVEKIGLLKLLMHMHSSFSLQYSSMVEKVLCLKCDIIYYDNKNLLLNLHTHHS